MLRKEGFQSSFLLMMFRLNLYLELKKAIIKFWTNLGFLQLQQQTLELRGSLDFSLIIMPLPHLDEARFQFLGIPVQLLLVTLQMLMEVGGGGEFSPGKLRTMLEEVGVEISNLLNLKQLKLGKKVAAMEKEVAAMEKEVAACI